MEFENVYGQSKNGNMLCVGRRDIDGNIIPLPLWENGTNRGKIKGVALENSTIVFYCKQLNCFYDIFIKEIILGRTTKFLIQYKNESRIVQMGNFLNNCNIEKIIDYFEYKNTFYKKDNYWVMTIKTKGTIHEKRFNGKELEILFDGDEETINKIKNSNWRLINKDDNKNNYYILTSNYNRENKNMSLHRAVWGEISKGQIVNYKDRQKDKWKDNRRSNLFIENEIKTVRKSKVICKSFTKNPYSICFHNDLKYIKIYNSKSDYCIVSIESLNLLDSGRITKIRKGYWSIRIDNVMYDLHRVVLNIPKTELEKIVVDHINHNPSDNRKENLIITTHLGNMANIKANCIYKSKKSYRALYCSYWEYILKHNSIAKIMKPSYPTEEEAVLEVKKRKWLANHIRPQFKTYQDYLIFKEEYENNNTNNLSVDDYWITTRFPNINDIKIPEIE